MAKLRSVSDLAYVADVVTETRAGTVRRFEVLLHEDDIEKAGATMLGLRQAVGSDTYTRMMGWMRELDAETQEQISTWGFRFIRATDVVELSCFDVDVIHEFAT